MDAETFELSRLAVVIALGGAGLLLAELVHRVVTRLARRIRLAAELARFARRAFQAFLTVTFLYAGDTALLPHSGGWQRTLWHTLLLGVIGAGAWFLTELLFVAEEGALARFRTDVENNRRARTVHTQVQFIRRITALVVTILALAAMLLTFRAGRLAGTSIFASTAVVGVVAGIAAQNLLGNVLAGLQLAFGGALRLEDVVVVEDEWGRIEEMTLTHVVVHIWDDRRLIMPTSYFTTQPFQNWTRTEAALLGTVLFDVDWNVPVARMREELRAVLSTSDLWDGRVSVLQVVDAVDGRVQVRALVSAADAPRLWDLRCAVREHLVNWLRQRHPEALPRSRAEIEVDGTASRHWAPVSERLGNGRDARAFGGDLAGMLRGEAFTGPEEVRTEASGDGADDPDRTGARDGVGAPTAGS
jgi:small-conductance mechanosensitive channel